MGWPAVIYHVPIEASGIVSCRLTSISNFLSGVVVQRPMREKAQMGIRGIPVKAEQYF